MKALSIRQPWAWLIVEGPKRVENRCRPDGRPPSMWRFRGTIAIHASKAMTREEYENARMCAHLIDGIALPHPRRMAFGAVVGVADVIGCLRPGGPFPTLRDQAAWWDPSQYGLQLSGVRAVEPIPCAGALGLWRLPPDVESRLLAQLRGTP